MSEQPEEIARPLKRAKKRNALKHGVYSRDIMLSGESFRGYDALAAELNEEWAPEGPTERGLVERLVGLYWRKQRLDRYENAKLKQSVEAIHESNQVNLHRQNLKDLGPEFNDAKSVEAVEKILSTLSPFYNEIITDAVPRADSQDTTPWGPAIGAYLSTLDSKDQLEGPAKFIAILDPDLIESNMARSDRIDEAIDRTIKRLMQVKTAKQIFPNMRNAKAEPKWINVPALTGPSEQANEKEQNVELLDKVEVFAKPSPSWSSVPVDYNKAILRIT
jgi:hypothetical protein